MSRNKVEQAIELIDEINLGDPNDEMVDGKAQPKEWLYGVRMSECLDQFKPQASDILKIAARAQHIRRWSVPRSDYPMNREGYFKWRIGLGVRHADEAMKIAAQAGFEQEEIDAIGRMLRKENIKRDPQVQALEDVICLVFLSFYFTDFAAKHSEEKIVRIVQKTWAKMSDEGHEAALKLPFTKSQQALLAKAFA